MIEQWTAEIEAIAAKVDAWCNFAWKCGWIGFGLSMVALVWLLVLIRRGNAG